MGDLDSYKLSESKILFIQFDQQVNIINKTNNILYFSNFSHYCILF